MTQAMPSAATRQTKKRLTDGGHTVNTHLGRHAAGMIQILSKFESSYMYIYIYYVYTYTCTTYMYMYMYMYRYNHTYIIIHIQLYIYNYIYIYMIIHI